MSNTITTSRMGFTKACATALTNTSFPSLVATATEPAGNGIIETLGGTTTFEMPSTLMLVPFGVGNANLTFSLRVTGWRKMADGLWVPVKLAELACTLGAATGVAAYSVLDTDKFVDTITVTGPNSYDAVSPADDTSAYVILDGLGFQKIQITADMTGATSGNALYAWL